MTDKPREKTQIIGIRDERGCHYDPADGRRMIRNATKDSRHTHFTSDTKWTDSQKSMSYLNSFNMKQVI